MLVRHPDWPSRLELFLRENVSRSFQYGAFDCCLFVADAIREMTGTDLAQWFRKRYATRDQAMDAIAEYTGVKTVRAVAERVARLHGMQEIPPAQARRGDMALIKRPRDYSLGVVSMNGCQVLVAMQEGYAAVPLARACRAWRVGV